MTQKACLENMKDGLLVAVGEGWGEGGGNQILKWTRYIGLLEEAGKSEEKSGIHGN
jgi:hypothetical protein